MSIIYKTNPTPTNEALNALLTSAWDSDNQQDFTKILSHCLAHICAYDDEMLVGFVNVAWDGGGHAFILDTSVHNDYQRRGIATQLVKLATLAAQQAKVEWLHVDYELHLTEFYNKCGFISTSAGLIKLQS